MKREPNPYASNPILTVTTAMSISVPSMVAEDVIDGSADKITGVDPAVLEEIKEDIREVSIVAELAKNAAGELQGAVDNIKGDMDSTSRLAYGLRSRHNTDGVLYVDAKDESGLVYLCVSGNGKHVEVTVDDLQNLANGNVGGSGAGVTLGPDVNSASLLVAGGTMAFGVSSGGGTSGTNLGYYKIAATGFVHAYNPKLQMRLQSNSSGQVALQLTGNSGGTWHSITPGGSSSDSGSTSNPDTEFVHGSISSLDPALVFEHEAGGSTFGYINNYYDYRSSAGVAILLGESPNNNSNLVYPLITPGIINAANRNCRLTWVDKTNQGGGSAIWDLQYTTDGGRNWNSLGTGSGSGSEATFTVDNPQSNGVHNLGANDHKLTSVISIRDAYSGAVYPIATTGWACPEHNKTGVYWNDTAQGYRLQFTEDGGQTWSDLGAGDVTNVVTTTSSGVSFVPYDTYYTQLIADASSGCINFVTQRKDGDITETGLRYGLQVALAAFDKPSVRLRFSGSGTTPKLQVQKGDGYAWEDFVISGGSSNSGTSSSSSSNTITFGPIYGDSKQYELSLALSDWRTDYASAIVELKEPTDNYRGVAALGAYLAAPARSDYDYNYDYGVTMAVSGMGALVFRRNSEIVKYDLNNLGSSNSSSGGSSSSSSGGLSLPLVNGDGYLLSSAIRPLQAPDIPTNIVGINWASYEPSDLMTPRVSGMRVLITNPIACYNWDTSLEDGGSARISGRVRPITLSNDSLAWHCDWFNSSDSNKWALYDTAVVAVGGKTIMKVDTTRLNGNYYIQNWHAYSLNTAAYTEYEGSGMGVLVANAIATFDGITTSADHPNESYNVTGGVRFVKLEDSTVKVQHYDVSSEGVDRAWKESEFVATRLRDRSNGLGLSLHSDILMSADKQSQIISISTMQWLYQNADKLAALIS